MSTLIEIEAAADSLPEAQKEELFTFLAGRLGKASTPPQPTEGEQEFRCRRGIRASSLGLPVIQGTPGIVINPTREQLDDFWPVDMTQCAAACPAPVTRAILPL